MKIFVDGSPNKVSFVVDGVPHDVAIPFSTNFEAEYKAIIEALKWVRSNMGTNMIQVSEHIVIISDSAVVVQQLLGMARVREPRLIVLYEEVQKLKEHLDIEFSWVSRKQNPAGRRLE
jgi:ribonuclease HI